MGLRDMAPPLLKAKGRLCEGNSHGNTFLIAKCHVPERGMRGSVRVWQLSREGVMLPFHLLWDKAAKHRGSQAARW